MMNATLKVAKRYITFPPCLIESRTTQEIHLRLKTERHHYDSMIRNNSKGVDNAD